ncbi:MAG: helix-turn-helix domain-containing protein [Rhodoblastus sp.]
MASRGDNPKPIEPRRTKRLQQNVRPEIPVFSLYGEDSAVAPEFIHLEDIRSRSERYRWEISEHRHHGLFQLLFLSKGAVAVSFGSPPVYVHGPFAIALPSDATHAFRFEPNAQGFVLTIEDSTLARASGGGARHPAALLDAPALIDLSEAPQQAASLAVLLEQIALEFREGDAASGAVLQGLASAALAIVLRLNAPALRAGSGAARDMAAFHRFRALVEAHFMEHWATPRYAEVLGVSESRLNRLCRTVAGKSALAVVQDRLTLEARRRLIHVAGPVASLAYELGFEDPAYFWRFFKRRTGMTPRAFRRRHESAATEQFQQK